MSDAILKSKAEIRSRVLKTIQSLTPAQRHEASVHACNRLMNLDVFTNASIIMLYMPLEFEVDVTSIAVKCFRQGKTVCVPRVDWDRKEMEAVEVTSLDDRIMDCDKHGVRSPKECSPMLPTMIDLVIVPGRAFDPQGNRLGRGGGYYDRFLNRLKRSATTIGLVFDQQIVDAVPVQPHDLAVDIVVTDRRVTMARATKT